MPSNQDNWQNLEDYLYALIGAAMTGSGVLAVQPNPNGTSGIQALTRNAPPERANFPNIGFMCTGFKEVISGSATHELVTEFVIVVSVLQPYAATVNDQGEAALQYLRTYQNDNAGNGISQLLRTDVTLGAMVQWSQITDMKRYILVGNSESDVIATAIYTFETHETLKLTL
jgi:hypothetical protein